MNQKPLASRGLRRGLSDLFSFPSLPFEWLAAWPLVHYGALFRDSSALANVLRTAIGTLIPADFFGAIAETVGLIMVTLTLGALWLQWKLIWARQIACFAGTLCMGLFFYSCWRSDVPWEISRIFFYYTGVHFFAGLLLHRDHKQAEGAGDG